MPKMFRCILFVTLTATLSVPASAGELQLSMANGRVTLIAHDVPLRQIFAEWARIGQTKIVNADKLVGPPVTLQLIDQPEGQVLELLLRSAAGYMAAPRPAGVPGTSVYDRIMILATSRPPAVTSTPPPPFANRQGFPQPVPQPVPQPIVEPDDDGAEPGPVGPPGMVPPGAVVPGMGQQPGMPPFPLQNPQGQGQQPVLTSPRPGPLPQPQQPGVPGFPNPFVPGGNANPYPQGRPGGGPGGDPDRN